MRAFVTGGTGFIGKELIRQLLERGATVRALVRTPNGAAELQALGVEPVPGDLDDLPALESGMQGCDVVFHLAAWFKLGARDQQEVERINVDGTRNVLQLAFKLGIPRIIYTSTVAVFGDTHGQLVNESYRMPADEKYLTEYDRTKWKAHYEVALPLIERGAPLIIVMPGGVIGPGDPSLIGEMLKGFNRGMFPILPGPELTLTFADVRDIAAGHILAAEQGQPGETYILTGPPLSMGEMMRLLAQVSGRRAPLFSIPARFVTPLAPVMGLLSRWLPIPALFSRDILAMLNASYTARSDKARRELGWQTRPLEDSLREIFAWMSREKESAPAAIQPGQQTAGIALAVLALFLAVWLLSRRRK